MDIQYTDIINYTPVTNGYLDDSGDWVKGSPGTPIQGKCRYETTSGSGLIRVADGSRVNYSGIVYLPGDSPEVLEGTVIQVSTNRNGQSQVLKDRVLRFFRGHFNARIWI